ncbi:MAG: carboxypeptidase-like regulatory domain-containing protein, partial [Planctomycetota bacterium]
MKKIWIVLLIASVFAAGLAIGRATSGDKAPKGRSTEARRAIAGETEVAKEESGLTLTVKRPPAGAGKVKASDSFTVKMKVAPGTKPSPDLPPGNHFVEGQVRVEGDHDPLQTELTLSSSGRGPDGTPYAHKRTGKLDGAGGFRFDGLPPGRYRITAKHPDYSPHSFDLEVTDGAYLEPLEIMLAP